MNYKTPPRVGEKKISEKVLYYRGYLIIASNLELNMVGAKNTVTIQVTRIYRPYVNAVLPTIYMN